MEVLKFGGTSVGSHVGRNRICELAESCAGGCVVVVSALGGVTDMLILLSKQSVGSVDHAEVMEKIRRRHRDAVEESIPVENCENVWSRLEILLGELAICDACEDVIVSYGERMSSLLMASMMGAVHLDSLGVMHTEPYFGRHIIDFVSTNAALRGALEGLRGEKVVMGGFISSDKSSGSVTNLGRGGSDYSAAVVAGAIGAGALYIYTDVDGFLSADPRIIPGAVLMEELGYIEAMELCNFGAKVLYSPTIFPAYNTGTPIFIRNTYGNDPGTKIHSDCSTVRLASGISSMNDTAVVELSGEGGLRGLNYRIFRELSAQGVVLTLVGWDNERGVMQLAMKNGDCDKAVQVLQAGFCAEIQSNSLRIESVTKNLATIAVVGGGIGSGVMQLVGTLEQAGIQIIASSGGESGTVMAFVIPLGTLRRAIAALHTALFETKISEMNVWLVGEQTPVGAELQKICVERSTTLLEKYGLELKIHHAAKVSEVSELGENCAVVDCSGTTINAEECKKMLEKGANIVLGGGNILLASATEFAEIQSVAAQKSSGKLKFGATISGGLPTIDVLQKMRTKGDRIRKIELGYSTHCTMSDADVVAAAITELQLLARELCGGGELLKIDIPAKIDNLAQLTATLDITQKTGTLGYQNLGPLEPLRNTIENSRTVLIHSDCYGEFPLQLKALDPESQPEKAIANRIYTEILSLARVLK